MVVILRNVLMVLLVLFSSILVAGGLEENHKSIHFGIMHPNGVDLVGYSVEKPLSTNIYSYYTFGIPALAALGVNYYEEYNGNGITTTAGVGIGSVLYASVAYQFQLMKSQYIKIGAGLTASVAYSGVYPVIAYEKRY